MTKVPLSRSRSRFRHSRRVRRLSLRWQQRLLFIAGGVAVGLVAIGLAAAADWAGAAFTALRARFPLAVLVVPPLGFAAARWLTGRYVPNASGSGIPQAIAARHLPGSPLRAPLVSLRVAAGKVLLLLLGLLCGASVGREGPTVQVGASLMFAVGRLSPRRQPGLILAGASAGVAAAFNTPLAGIVFGIEEMSRSFETRTSGMVLGAVIAAGVTSLGLQGDYVYFGTTHAGLGDWRSALAVPLLGIAGGLAGGAFSRVLILFADGLPGRVGRLLRAHPVWFAASCGLCVVACGLLSDGTTFGTGYAQARALVQGGGVGTPESFGALKWLATAASSISGIPGGIFAPSLAVGAGLGANMAWLLPGAPLPTLAVLGMAAYFAGVVQAPITAFVIVSEMTNDHELILPLMLASVIGFATSRLICAEGLYHALARNFIANATRAGA